MTSDFPLVPNPDVIAMETATSYFCACFLMVFYIFTLQEEIANNNNNNNNKMGFHEVGDQKKKIVNCKS